MKTLGITTSSDICSVCLLDDTKIIKELTLNNQKTHSENLVPLLKQLLLESEINFKDINLISIDKGPGSFTGIRIGISTIKAVCEIHKIPIIGITSLKGLIYNLDLSDIPIISLIDARNNQVYCGIFEKRNNDILENYYALDIYEVIDIINNKKFKDIILIGNGAVLHKKILSEEIISNTIFSENNNISSTSIALAGYEMYKTHNISESSDTILPFYLRKSQAERMKDLKNNGNNK